eukprot:scaffold27882_cov122-Isochrysis_galbana.AAC.2
MSSLFPPPPPRPRPLGRQVCHRSPGCLPGRYAVATPGNTATTGRSIRRDQRQNGRWCRSGSTSCAAVVARSATAVLAG